MLHWFPAGTADFSTSKKRWKTNVETLLRFSTLLRRRIDVEIAPCVIDFSPGTVLIRHEMEFQVIVRKITDDGIRYL